MEKVDRKIRKLRDKAEKLRQAGNLKKALEIYHELERREPNEPRWPHLAGEAHKRFGQVEESVEHFTKAAELYNKKGFDVKCVAMCKILLGMDPLNETGNRLLEKVSGQRPQPQLPQNPEPPPRTASEVALAATGGPQMFSAPSSPPAPRTPSPLPPATPPKRSPAKETSPKELQALDLSDLEEIFDDDAQPSSPPPPPVPTAPPRIPAPARPAGGALRTTPSASPEKLVDKPPEMLVDKPPRPDPSSVHRIGKFTESLDISIEIEGMEESADEGDSGSNATLMESLQSNAAEEKTQPRKPPQLAPDAPLESLELEDVLPGTHRMPSGKLQRKTTEELFEVDISQIEEVSSLEEVTPKPSSSSEYKMATPRSRQRPATTPPGLFKKLGIDAMKSLVAQMTYIDKQPGEVIVKQGDIGGSLYVIIRGEVAIVREVGGERIQVATLTDGEFFGEMALLTDTPRLASVEAVTAVEMFELSRDTLRRLIHEFPQVVPTLISFLKDRLLEIFVKTSDLLRPVPEEKRWVLARKFKLYEIKEGKVIVKEGKPSGGLMIFLAGTAQATRKRGEQTVVLGDLQPGNLVGEISLLTGGPAVATVTAKSKAWLLAISQRQWKALTNAFPKMQEYVEQLAEKRRKENAALVSGGATYTSQTLRLV